MVAGTVSRLRPPWFETMMPDAPDLTAFSTWSGSNIPLSRMGPLEKGTLPLDIFPSAIIGIRNQSLGGFVLARFLQIRIIEPRRQHEIGTILAVPHRRH